MAKRTVELRAVTLPLIALMLVVFIWQSAHGFFEVKSIILPSPIEVGVALKDNAAKLLRETGITLFESVCGFLLGSVVAFLLAVLFVHFSSLRLSIYPFAVALKSTPLIAIAPLLVLWFGNDLLSKIVMSALVAFFPVLVNATKGLGSLDKEALDLMKSMYASRWQVLIKLRIPNSLPLLFSALRIASSLAVVGAVIGEFTGATRGIGHLIVTSSYYFQTDLMFAGILMISMGGILFFGLVGLIEKKVVFWHIDNSSN